MSTFEPSSRYERWITSFRLPWMARVGRRMWGGFAAALGDKTVDWLTQGLLEHLPGYASDPASVALTASERQLDTNPLDTTADIAARALQWLAFARYYGTPLGILMGLHFSGFDDAVVVQQTGLAYQLTLPLPDFDITSVEAWDPKPNLIKTRTTSLAVALGSSVTPRTSTSSGRVIPAGSSWFQLGPSPTGSVDTDFCSRFAVLFAPPLAGPFASSAATARAVFSGTDTAAVTWSVPMAVGSPAPTYFVTPGPAIVTDGGGHVTLAADWTTATALGVTIRASGPFTGYADVSAFGLTAPDAARLQTTLARWRPKKATCMGVYACLQGKFMGWPLVPTQADNTMGPATIFRFDAGA